MARKCPESIWISLITSFPMSTGLSVTATLWKSTEVVINYSSMYMVISIIFLWFLCIKYGAYIALLSYPKEFSEKVTHFKGRLLPKYGGIISARHPMKVRYGRPTPIGDPVCRIMPLFMVWSFEHGNCFVIANLFWCIIRMHEALDFSFTYVKYTIYNTWMKRTCVRYHLRGIITFRCLGKWYWVQMQKSLARTLHLPEWQ